MTTPDKPNTRRDQLVNAGLDELKGMLSQVAKDFTFGGGASAKPGDHIVIVQGGQTRGAVVEQIGLRVENEFGLRAANPDGTNPQPLTYRLYGTSWTIPASGKPHYTAFSGSVGTGPRRVTIDVVPHPDGRDPGRPDPPGYSSAGPWNRRGHLVAKMFGGPGGQANIVAMTFAANQTGAGMRSIEDAVRDDVRKRGSVFEYKATPVYTGGRRPSADPPTSVLVVADELYPGKAAAKFSKDVSNT
jgi:DNA/RNA non-specific endonuclease